MRMCSSTIKNKNWKQLELKKFLNISNEDPKQNKNHQKCSRDKHKQITNPKQNTNHQKCPGKKHKQRAIY